MTLTRVTAPAEQPVSLDEAKAHLRVDGTDEDTLIQLYLDAAVAHLDGNEGILGRCLVSQTWECTLDRFCGDIRVPLPELTAVVSVKYQDDANAEQTLAPSAYTVSGQRIVAGEAGWPGTYVVPDAVKVRFTAGYADAASVPAAIKAAILLYVGDMYANREARGAQLFDNPAAAALLRPFKRVRV